MSYLNLGIHDPASIRVSTAETARPQNCMADRKQALMLIEQMRRLQSVGLGLTGRDLRVTTTLASCLYSERFLL